MSQNNETTLPVDRLWETHSSHLKCRSLQIPYRRFQTWPMHQPDTSFDNNIGFALDLIRDFAVSLDSHSTEAPAQMLPHTAGNVVWTKFTRDGVHMGSLFTVGPAHTHPPVGLTAARSLAKWDAVVKRPCKKLIWCTPSVNTDMRRCKFPRSTDTSMFAVHYSADVMPN